MSRIKQFKLPDLGEGLTEGEILAWLVKPGDEVTQNQPIVEVETAKAAVEIPSPYVGVVTELFCVEGDTVEVGTPIIAYDTEPGAGPAPGGAPSSAGAPSSGGAPASNGATAASNGAASSATAAGPAVAAEAVEEAAEEEAVEAGLIGGPAPGGRTAVLVGYGPRQVAAKRRPRKGPASAPPAGPVGVAAAPPVPAPVATPAAPEAMPAATADLTVLAKPPVRKLAKELGVDLRTVTPTGPRGSISRDDVMALVEQAQPAAPAAPAAPAGLSAPVFGADREQRIPVKGVRKLTAENMVASAFTAPHVTEFLTVDATRTVRACKRLAAMPDWDGVRISPLLLVAKAVLVAARRHPMINSSWDAERDEIVLKQYVNLGIAAATPRGLIVPNIKDAGRLSLRELADALRGLVGTAKEGKTSPADMQGGTFTITNVGVFGVDTGTPILPPGEAAILAFGAIREQPWVHKGKVKPRQVTTLALSFDHRIVDGELGSKFLADVGRFLTDPEAALLAWA